MRSCWLWFLSQSWPLIKPKVGAAILSIATRSTGIFFFSDGRVLESGVLGLGVWKMFKLSHYFWVIWEATRRSLVSKLLDVIVRNHTKYKAYVFGFFLWPLTISSFKYWLLICWMVRISFFKIPIWASCSNTCSQFIYALLPRPNWILWIWWQVLSVSERGCICVFSFSSMWLSIPSCQREALDQPPSSTSVWVHHGSGKSLTFLL